jgi:uncharacterized protein YutE (UPF0331/DUF86 family)
MTAGVPDADLVRRHLAALDAAVQTLRRHTGRPAELLRTDVEEAWVVERGLQLCAQNCLDVATHLAASAGHDVPDYATAIDILGRMAVLTAEFTRGFRGIAGFRNIVVHGYLAVDADLLHRLLNERLDDFGVFAAAVERYLASLPT